MQDQILEQTEQSEEKPKSEEKLLSEEGLKSEENEKDEFDTMGSQASQTKAPELKKQAKSIESPAAKKPQRIGTQAS